jgi:hypothetical protein
MQYDKCDTCNWWIIHCTHVTDRENRSTSRKSCPTATLSTANPLGSNPDTVATDWRLTETWHGHSRTGHFVEDKYLLLLPGTEHWIFKHTACSQHWLGYCGSLDLFSFTCSYSGHICITVTISYQFTKRSDKCVCVCMRVCVRETGRRTVA